jgi:hypothetical protein
MCICGGFCPALTCTVGCLGCYARGALILILVPHFLPTFPQIFLNPFHSLSHTLSKSTQAVIRLVGCAQRSHFLSCVTCDKRMDFGGFQEPHICGPTLQMYGFGCPCTRNMPAQRGGCQQLFHSSIHSFWWQHGLWRSLVWAKNQARCTRSMHVDAVCRSTLWYSCKHHAYNHTPVLCLCSFAFG